MTQVEYFVFTEEDPHGRTLMNTFFKTFVGLTVENIRPVSDPVGGGMWIFYTTRPSVDDLVARRDAAAK